MSKKEYIVLQPKETIVDVEYSDGTVVRTNHRFWYDGEVAHLKFFVNDNKQVAELKQQLTEKDKKIRELKEELEDETDFKNEYYKYWQDLKKEMTQKNKEIGQLKFNLANQRHQICEEIRDFVELNEDWGTILVCQIYEFLKELEKGE